MLPDDFTSTTTVEEEEDETAPERMNGYTSGHQKVDTKRASYVSIFGADRTR